MAAIDIHQRDELAFPQSLPEFGGPVATEPKVRFSPKDGTDFNKINILSSQRIAVCIKSGFDAGKRLSPETGRNAVIIVQ